MSDEYEDVLAEGEWQKIFAVKPPVFTKEEKKARLFLATLGIDYDKLTPEEFVTQINILKKSEHLKSPNNQRGKAVPYQVHGKGNRKKQK